MPPSKAALLGFLMLRVFLVPLAVFDNHQPGGSQFFVLGGMIVDVVTNRAFQHDKIIL